MVPGSVSVVHRTQHMLLCSLLLFIKEQWFTTETGFHCLTTPAFTG